MEETIKQDLLKHHQEHLLKFWDELSGDEKKQLLRDVAQVNLPEANHYYQLATQSLSSPEEKLDDKLQPLPEEQRESVVCLGEDRLRGYEERGLEAVGLGQVGVLLMAGGQGTRLGFAFPKGMFNVGLPSQKSLFQIQAERILKLQELALNKTGKSGKIVWYIMTSEHTMDKTAEYFESNHYFGLNKSEVKFFQQGSLPCFDMQGKIMLESKFRIARAPDGNGGLYRALKVSGMLQDMRERGVQHLHAHSVDNILIKVADPVFIGYCIDKAADCAAKVVEKSSPSEAVGVLCLVDGEYQVVEYSEITQATAERRNADGKLTFSAGNICNHYFSREFLEKMSGEDEAKLKCHVAKKKIPCIDLATGSKLNPEKPNGIKIEKFIFDSFPFCNKLAALEIFRDVEFTALKNADSAGKDCPSTAREDVFRLHRKYVRQAGGCVADDVQLEISPLLSYAGEGLEDVVKGKTFSTSPTLLTSNKEQSKLACSNTNGKH